MNLSTIATLISLLAVAGSFIYACVRVGLVAGRTDGKLSTLASGLAELTTALREFATRADDRLNNHGEQLAETRAFVAAHNERLANLEARRREFERTEPAR